jgi:hypothetical protein
MHGQAFLAGIEIGRQLAADERVKVTCSRSAKVVVRAHPAAVD